MVAILIECFEVKVGWKRECKAATTTTTTTACQQDVFCFLCCLLLVDQCSTSAGQTIYESSQSVQE
jgi:hypothetical protein